jgi:hypothetical protein
MNFVSGYVTIGLLLTGVLFIGSDQDRYCWRIRFLIESPLKW